MQKTVYKWFWAWEADREEEWLVDMARQGWALAGVGYAAYHFERCAPGEYMIRLELLDRLPGDPRSREYINFVESTGAEYLGNVMRWAYFRKKAAEGTFELFSDLESRIRHLERMLCLLIPLAAAATGSLLFNAVNLAGRPDLPVLWFCVKTVLLCAGLLWYGVGQIWSRRRALAAERFLRE